MAKSGEMVLAAALASGALCAHADASRKINISAVEEFGVLQSGRYLDRPFRDDWVSHFGVSAGQTAAVNEALKFDIALGGVFAYQKPQDKVSAQWPDGTQWKMFLVGPTVADIRYLSAATGEDGFGFQLGMFNYKYNPDAADLGEYLFRAGAYPGYLITGGHVLLDGGTAQVQGMKANYKMGPWTADFIVTTETTLPAFYDFSPALVLGYKSAGGFLDFGAGLHYKHLIPVRPSRISAKVQQNAYFEKDGVEYTGQTSYYMESSRFYNRRAAEDPANAAAYLARAQADSATGVQVQTWLDDPAAAGIDLQYYTQRGLIAMLRLNLDFKPLLGMDALGPQDLRVFAEAALLGAQNYPVFYNKRMERVPVMFGINLPGFRILDLISLQGEYYSSPYINSYGAAFGGAGVPDLPRGEDAPLSKTAYNDRAKKDNLAWSLLLKKKIAGAAWVSAQFARDHSRLASQSVWGGPGWVPNEVMGDPKDWYWMMQFGFGI